MTLPKSTYIFIIILVLLGGVGVSLRSTHYEAHKYFSDPQVFALYEAGYDGDIEKIDQLITQGVDINAVGSGGLSPFYLLFLSDDEESSKKEVFRYFLENGADPMQVDPKTKLPLLFAITEHPDPYYLKTLLEISPKIDINYQVSHTIWSTPLVRAILGGNVDNFERLIKKGANIEKRNNFEETPLQFASGTLSWKFALILLLKGADYTVGITKNSPDQRFEIVRRIENDRYSPSIAIKRDGVDYRQKVIEFLREKGVEVDPWYPKDYDGPR